MSLKLSHSAIDTYRTCSEKYRLHYIERLREEKIYSPLFFGSALDAAEEVLLLRKKKNLTEKEQEKLKLDPYEVFNNTLSRILLNNKWIHVPDSTKVVYSKADFDVRLLKWTDFAWLEMYTTDILTVKIPSTKEEAQQYYDEFLQLRENPDWYTEDELKVFNLLNYVSLRAKGVLLLEEYERSVLPRINEVYSIQRAVKLTNDEGDVLRGYLDFVADWEDEGKVLFDNKTSSRKYGPKAVQESQQLIIYGEDEEHYKAGFIVLLKAIKFKKKKTCNKCETVTERRIKRCTKCKSEDWSIEEIPQPEIQVLIDELDHSLQEKVFGEIEEIAQNIKEEKFEQNRSACFEYNRKCQFYDVCRNGSKKGLVNLNEKK